MKKILSILIIGFLFFSGFSVIALSEFIEENHHILYDKETNYFIDGPQEEWNKTYGGINDEYAMFRSLKQTSYNEFLLFAQTYSFGSGSSDIWLLKIDSDGNELLNKTFGGIDDEWPGWILETSDGGYIFTGTTFSFGNGESDLWLVKTDSDGNIQWDKTMGGSDSEWGQHIFDTSDGGYFIAARTNSYGAGQYDNWLIKTDENGNIIWDKTIGTRGAEWGGFVIQTSDGGYASIGYTTDPDVNDFDMQLIKMDENGNELWSKTYDNRGMEHGHGLRQCSDGSYILTGLSSEYWGGESDIFIVKTDNMGNELWSKTLGGGEHHDVGNTVILTSDDNFLITGSLDSDLCLLKIDYDGNILYSYKIGGEGDDSGGDLIQLEGGEYIISGYTDSFGSGGYDAWLLKLSISENSRPNKPLRPTGEANGKTDQEYIYTTSTTDPDDDDVFYLFDWGNGMTSFILGPYASGVECSGAGIWFDEGNYEIKVKAIDVHGAESEWSDPLVVSMPKQKKSSINIINEWYYYPKLENYAPSGMPDFDQRQDDWRNQINMAWSFCGPTALSNVLWYIDSKYSNPSGFPGDGNDQFALVQDYDAPGTPDPGPSNDDHNFNNVNDLETPWEPDNELYGNEIIEKIAWYTDNDGVRTGGSQTGSSSSDIYDGAVQWIEDIGLNDSIDVIVHDPKNENSLNDIINHIENEDFVLLNLGFYTSSGTSRGNHWVTIAGISRSLSKIALSDPYYDVTNYTTDYSEHNDANNVSHDIFTINNTSPLPQRSSWWLDDYEPDFAPSTKAMIKDAIIIAPAISNQPPNKPTISGPASGKSETEYTYKGVSYDDNGDQLFYLFDWGNGMTSFILGPYASGVECNASNIWFEQGEYEVKVKAIDIHNAESEWSDPLSVSMPKNKSYNDFNPWMLRLIQRFPILEFLI